MYKIKHHRPFKGWPWIIGGLIALVLLLGAFPFFARAPESKKLSFPSFSPIPEPQEQKEMPLKEFQIAEATRVQTQWESKKVLQWGGSPPAIGGRPYDPGSGNGMSGGAMPLDIWANARGDFFLTDGYGPRLLQFNTYGQYQKMVDFKVLRPDHFDQIAALAGFRTARDVLGRWIILDQEKKVIHGFNVQGKWIKTWDIADLLKDHYLIHDIHPEIQVAGKELFYLRLTVSDPNEDTREALKGIPVRNTRLVGIWLDGCYGTFQEVSPQKTFFVYGYDAWHIERNNHEQWFIQHNRLNEGEWKPYQRWYFEDFPHQGGDLIGLDYNGNLYWWSSSSRIAFLNIISHQLYEIVLPLREVFHPVAVDPEGGILLVLADTEQVNIYHMHWFQD